MAREKKLDIKEDLGEVKEVKVEKVDYLKELIEEQKKNDKLAGLIVTYKETLDEKIAECADRKKKYNELWNAFLQLKSMK